MNLHASHQVGCITPAASETDLEGDFSTSELHPAGVRVRRSPVWRAMLQEIIGSSRSCVSFLVCWDLCAGAFALGLGYLVFSRNDPEVAGQIGLWAAVPLWGLIFMVSALALGLYERPNGEGRVALILRSAVATIMAWVIVAACNVAVPLVPLHGGMVAFSSATLILAALGGRIFLRHIQSTLPVNLIVLGDERVARSIRVEGAQGLNPPLRVLAVESTDRDVLLELTPDLHGRAGADDLDRVSWVVVQGDCKGSTLEQLLPFVESGTRLCDVSGFFERFFQKVPVEIIDSNWLIQADVSLLMLASRVVKRTIDILGAIVGLVLTMPVWPPIALLIKLSSKGAVFYTQERVGRNGRVFRIFKFRTMNVDAESSGQAVWASRGDTRVTSFGRFLRKTRLDELPQFLNVLAGDMSLVGPRPERPEFVQMLAQSIPHYQMRHLVRPGLTGWAQISYCYGASVEDSVEKLKYDLYYIKYGGLLLDLQIVFRTIGVCMRGAR
jgi:exopolysaccharide biosynthesis polyprenyl glycosylphosphotransferase